MRIMIFLLALALLSSCQNVSLDDVRTEGDLMQWHKVTLLLAGPETSEFAEENPFLNYRVEVTFSSDGKELVVPAYYAADGNAGESGAKSGSMWRVHFRPDEPGTWNYMVSFRKGRNIAILDGPVQGEPAGCDGAVGSIEIAASDKSGPDFRAKGRIVNGGKGYFNFQGSDEIWIKNGADSPENFLAYHEFDQTSRFTLKKEVREGEADPRESLHRYESHVADWKDGDPTWKDGMGKGIIGAVNYLQSAGVNSVYMLTMNILGDGKDVWPYTDYNERYRFDCSKLDQWAVLFDHMESLGVMMHFVLQETENEVLLDAGQTGVQRRVYLRELVARYGHYLAVSWNMGEENGIVNWSPVGQTDQHRKDMAAYLKAVNPYPSIVVLHTLPDAEHQELVLHPLLGFEHLDGPSMQTSNPSLVHSRVLHFVQKSEEVGKPWLVCQDEIGPHWKGVMPDSHDPDHDTVRHQSLWGALMGGAAGVEWYFGYRYPHTDLTCEDFRSRDLWWKQSSIATRFIQEFPLEEMKNMNELVNVKEAYCLAKPGELYLVYLNEVSGARVKLDAGEGMELRWFNPRKGGELQEGGVKQISGNGKHSIGQPPSDADEDWVVLIRKKY